MSLSSHPILLTLVDQKEIPVTDFYKQLLVQGYKRLNMPELEGHGSNNIIPVTLIATLLNCMGEGDFTDFKTFFIRAFGEQNALHAQSLWLEMKEARYMGRYIGRFAFMEKLMDTWSQAIAPGLQEQAEFEQKTSAEMYPSLCADEAFIFQKISQRLEIRINILLSRTQKIIFGMQYQNEIILTKQQTNKYYFFVSPKAASIDMSGSMTLEGYQLPVVINCLSGPKKSTVLTAFLYADVFKSILSFLHPKDSIDELEPLKQVNKFFNHNTEEYKRQFFRNMVYKPAYELLTEHETKGTSIEYYLNTIKVVLTKNPEALLAPMLLKALLSKQEAKDDKTIEEDIRKALENESKLPEEQQLAIRQLALKRYEVTSYVALGKPAKLKAFLEAKENADFDLNFAHDIFISLSFVNALLPNQEIQQLLTARGAELLPQSTPESLAKYMSSFVEIIGNERARRVSVQLVNIFVSRLPAIALLKPNEDRMKAPMIMYILAAGIYGNLPIQNTVNHLLMQLSQAGLSLDQIMNSDGNPWLSSLVNAGKHGNHAVDMIEMALKNGLDKSFFTNDNPEITSKAIQCLHQLATLPSRILALFITLYPDFYAAYVDSPLGKDQVTTLHYIAGSRTFENIDFLLESQLVHMGKTNREGYNFFHLFIKESRTGHRGAKYNAQYFAMLARLLHHYPELSRRRTKAGLSLFLLAASEIKYDLLEILETKHSHQHRDYRGNTALHLVFQNEYNKYQHIKVAATVRKLLAMGHDVNAVNDQNITPVFFALRKLHELTCYSDDKHLIMLELIEEMLAATNASQFKSDSSDDNLLKMIARLKNFYGQRLILKLLKSKKISPDQMISRFYSDRYPLFHCVVEERYIEVVRYILSETNADVNACVNSYNETPFELCCARYKDGDEEMVDLFLEHPKINIIVKKDHGNTFNSVLNKGNILLAFKLLSSIRMEPLFSCLGSNFMDNIVSAMCFGSNNNLGDLSKMLMILLKRSDFKFDISPSLLLYVLERRGQAMFDANLINTYKLMLLHPNADTRKYFQSKQYSRCIYECSRVQPVDLAASFKNMLIAMNAILQGEECLKQNKFKQAERHFNAARKFDNSMLEQYLKQVSDQFKACYSFSAEQMLFLSNNCRPVALVCSDDQEVVPLCDLFTVPVTAFFKPPVSAVAAESKVRTLEDKKDDKPNKHKWINVPSDAGHDTWTLRGFRVSKC